LRALTVGLTGIAVFAAAAIGGVWLLTRDDRVLARPEPSPAPDAEPPLAPAPPLPVAPLPLGYVPPAPLTGAIPGPPRIAPPEDSWEAVPIVARASALGAVGGAIGRGLIALQPRLAACSGEDAQARYGTASRTYVKDPYPPDRQGGTVLVLQIETTRGKARIVDAPVQSQGRASDGLVACVQDVLRGETFPVPQGQAGQRYRLMHPVR
jgi:hypothetical protein